MYRITALIVRDKDIAASAFSDLLVQKLVPKLVAAVGDDRRLARLVVNRRPDDLDAEVASIFPAVFDGMLEFWFNSIDDATAIMNQLTGDAEVRKAAAGLIDGSRGVAWLAEVYPSKPDDTGATRVKFLAGGEVAEGWTVAAAQEYWRDSHPALARTVPEVWDRLSRYTQFHGREAPGLEMGEWLARYRFVPLCSDMGFADARDFIALYTNERYLEIIRPDEEKFSRPGEMLAFVSGEERVLVDRSKVPA